VWNQEFTSYDEDDTGMIDIECLSFALAKLRLLEDLDVEQAAAELESKLVEVDTDCTGEFTFEDFCIFGASLRALAQHASSKPSAKPVAVKREYVFNADHPFKAYFDDVAPSGEIDGEAFSETLKAAGLVDGKALSDTGVDVIFARAKARHPGAGRQVPYRIFLGALSLTAGHLRMPFTTMVERLMGAGGGGGGGVGALSEGASGSAANAMGGPPTPFASVGSSPSPEAGTTKKKKSSFSSGMSFFIKPAKS